MKTTLTIDCEKRRERAIELIKSFGFEDPKEIHEVIIRPIEHTRSAAQNRIYWKWLGVIGDDLGYFKDEIHTLYKRQYLLPIIREDPATDAMFREAAALSEESKKIIIEYVSTSRLSVELMTKYLKRIEVEAAEFGIILPTGDDAYYEAMGIRRK